MSTPITRRRFLKTTAALAAAATQTLEAAEPTAPPPVLHFAQPAAKWPDALPTGNGRLGAMVFGDPALERIQLNEESIWDGQPGLDRNNPGAAAAVPRIRELLFAGKIAEAEALATTDLLAIPRRLPCYQTLGDLHLDFAPMGLAPGTPVEDYRLELDLGTAIVTTTYTYAGVRYTREVFVSAPDQVIVVHLTSSAPGRLAFDLALTRNGAKSALPPDVLEGQALPVNDNPGLPFKEPQTGVRFHARMFLLSDGADYTKPENTDRSQLSVRSASQATILIDCATSYRYPSAAAGPLRFIEGDLAAMRAAVDRNLRAALLPHANLRQRHIDDYRSYFNRAAFHLGPDLAASTPTDVRVSRIKAGGEDPQLYPLYFQFGRYLLISSSRPGTLASNLQGIWNESVDPPWGSKYTVNINAQMNYWLAERANLADLHAPLFDLLAQTRGPGVRTAKAYYGASGSVVHHNTDLWGDAVPIDGLGGGVWAMGSAWLCLHLWEHYEYTGDLSFLRNRTYPVLRDNAAFLLDYLVKAPAGTPYAGLLVTGPSCSPENKYELPTGKSYNLCMGPTMDLAITRAVLTRLLDTARTLGIGSDDLLTRARAALPQLPPYRILPDGRLAEWPEDYRDQEPGHRHISHLFGLYPGEQITPAGTPELARAARATLDARLAAGSGSTGWSRAWIVNCMARLGDGDACWHNLLELVRQCTRHNLFDVCGLKENSPFQIDGNLGAPAGIAEMLLQSHEVDATGQRTLRLLPALPKAWSEGEFRGLRARGGLEVDVTWSQGRAKDATLRATSAASLRIVLPGGQRATLKGSSGSEPTADGSLILRTRAGKTYRLSFPSVSTSI